LARIAIDLHGGDFGPSVLIPSSFKFFLNNPQHHGVLVGDSRVFKAYISKSPSNIEWIDADDIGDLAHKPARLLRNVGHSSIETCFRALHNQDVDVLVSAEHTGVLLALISKYGKLHSLLNRPVLASWLPSLDKKTVMLDLGASFVATHDQLLAYAAVGAGILRNKAKKPSLGLLNVGTEHFKGPTEIRLANESLKSWSGIDYQGFIEANEVFRGELDIIVTDGFTGNSIIKSSEGALDLTFKLIKGRLNSGFISKLLALWLKRQMKLALKPLDPRTSNGALVAGSNLLVIKSHGNAQERAFESALCRAVEAHGLQMTGAIWSELDNLLDEDVRKLT
jgi:glycerol-3-phosphate acyltransferase PlsX